MLTLSVLDSEQQILCVTSLSLFVRDKSNDDCVSRKRITICTKLNRVLKEFDSTQNEFERPNSEFETQ